VLDSWGIVDLNSDDVGDFLFPEFAARHATQIEMFVPYNDFRLHTLHAVGNFVQGAARKTHQHQQQCNSDCHSQNAQGAANFTVGEVCQGKFQHCYPVSAKKPIRKKNF